MTSQKPTLSLEEFVDLLTQLDRFIESQNPELHISVRAIGGFSLMYHEQATSLAMLRRGSSDIDTLTMLPRQIATMVDIVSLFRFFGISTTSDLESIERPVEIVGFDRFILYCGDTGILQA